MANAGTSRGKTTNNGNAANDIQMLATSMKGKLDKLHLLSPNCSIYKVPKILRKINEAAFTPRRVSIGPLHHGKKGLKPAEEHKWRYLQDFLERSQKSTLEDFLIFVKYREERIRECYAEPITLSSNKFVEMILVDTAFVIEILLRFRFLHLSTKTDRIFNRPRMVNDIVNDLLLLENQLPLFILQELFEMANIEVDSNAIQDGLPYPAPITLYCSIFLLKYKNIEFIVYPLDTSEVEHLIDLLRICYIPRERSEVPHIQMDNRNVIFPKSATELHEAGVKFKVSSSKNLFDITFGVADGVLQLPHIKISDKTESLLRNLVAFEQCHYVYGYMSDYVAFMDSLINTSKDVELLVQSGIIENWLGNYEEVSDLYNKLWKNIVIYPKYFYFSQLSNELNDYCKIRRHKWKATLRHNYFKTPWRVLSVVAAAILLLLTFIQTMCSIISVTS